MLEEANVQDMRLILQAAGIRKWRIQNAVVKAIHSGQLKQKTRSSAILTPGEITIEQFMDSMLNRFKRTYTTVDASTLPPSSRKLLHTLTMKNKTL